MAGLSLAEQIARLDDAAPADVDIEHLENGPVEDEEEDKDLLAARSHYLDVGVSFLRKERDELVDAKYDGTRTSRSQIYEFDEGSDDEQLSSQTSGSDLLSGDESQEEEVDDAPKLKHGHDALSEEEPSADIDGEDTISKPASPTPDETTTDGLTQTLKKDREADKDKGRAVIRQRVLYDGLVETRIRMQKATTATNRLPHPDNLPPYVTSDAGREAAQTLLTEVLAFSDDLLSLRKRLLDVNETEMQISPPKRRKLSDGENMELQTCDATMTATELDAAYHPSCVRTLQKWSSKIAAVTPTLSNRSKSFRGGGAPRSTVELIEEALGESGTNGTGKAIGRTRMRRSGGTRIGKAADLGESVEKETDGGEGDAEFFDDLDFYQSLLRDVIDGRSGTDGTEDWTTRQRLKKAKKVVDTKASKGRKLRYEVHEKLQNFMVPVPTGTWHEEQIDELFANLLGRVNSGDQPISV